MFAYRLIARGTVEQRVLELGRQKRGLADAILNADSRLLRDLRREHLELLLSSFDFSRRAAGPEVGPYLLGETR